MSMVTVLQFLYIMLFLFSYFFTPTVLTNRYAFILLWLVDTPATLSTSSYFHTNFNPLCTPPGVNFREILSKYKPMRQNKHRVCFQVSTTIGSGCAGS